MNLFKHRINTIEELLETPRNYGVEIDIRSWGQELIVTHDPFVFTDLTLSSYLQNYDHNGIILNVKEEGLEEKVLETLSSFDVSNFFFLDQTIPYMLKLLDTGENRTCHKLSDIESIENLKLIKPKPGWVWVDSWSGEWDHLTQISEVSDMGYQICLCSPDVHRTNFSQELSTLQNLIEDLHLSIDAVCTKYPENWLK
jgi:hypothetical protein